jgi:hypothetical protein
LTRTLNLSAFTGGDQKAPHTGLVYVPLIFRNQFCAIVTTRWRMKFRGDYEEFRDVAGDCGG